MMRGMRQRSVRLCVWPVFFAGILCFSGPQHHVGRGLSRHVPSCTRRALPKLDSLALTQARVVRHDDSGTIVCLVGCMHFNPFSTFCAKSLTTEMMESNALAAVVLEMFDERWQRMRIPQTSCSRHTSGFLDLVLFGKNGKKTRTARKVCSTKLKTCNRVPPDLVKFSFCCETAPFRSGRGCTLVALS